MTAIQHILSYCTSKRIAIALAFIVLTLVFLYIYLLFMSVVHVVIRTELQHDIKAVAGDISRYESTYIASQHQVSEQLAVQSGYVQVEEKDFIDRAKPQYVLSVLSAVE